jgi:glycosyltransferase involved in cell wall biosynthesis
MRVAFVQAWLTRGGAERLVQTLMTHMDPARVSTVAINLYGAGAVGEELIRGGHTVVSGLTASRFSLGTGRRLERALDEHGAELVYVFDSALPLYWCGRIRRRRARPRLVVGFHSTGKLRREYLQHRIANHAALGVADRYVALAESHRRFLCRSLRLRQERVAVIPSGVDTGRFHPAADRRSARHALGLPEQGPLVGTIAALRPEKNQVLLLEAAARLGSRHPEAHFLVVGDGPERSRLERAARRRGLGHRLRFLGARDDIPELARALDVAVLCSRPVVETLPLTLLEAAASGVPVVSTEVGSVRDLVAEGETGFLVPPGDAAALAERIGRLLSDEPMRAAMGRAARARALQRFRLDEMVRAYERLFLEVGAA